MSRPLEMIDLEEATLEPWDQWEGYDEFTDQEILDFDRLGAFTTYKSNEPVVSQGDLDRFLSNYFKFTNSQNLEHTANEIKKYFPEIGSVLHETSVIRAIQTKDPFTIQNALRDAANLLGVDTTNVMNILNPFIPTPVRTANNILPIIGNILRRAGGRFQRGSRIQNTFFATADQIPNIIAALGVSTGAYGAYKLISAGVSGVVSGIRSLLPWSTTPIPPPLGNATATDEHQTVGHVVDDVMKMINKVQVYENDTLAIQTLTQRSGVIATNTSQNDLESNVLSLLKRRLIESLQSMEKMSDFTTSAMKNRSLQPNPIHPRLQGFPTRVI